MDRVEEDALANEKVLLMRDFPEQLAFYHEIQRIRGEGGYRFLDAPGGTGKTFLLNAIVEDARANGDVAISVASSGISALLLDRGSTMHSRFKAPVHDFEPGVPEPNMANPFGEHSAHYELLRRVSLIVWDEAPMMHRWLLDYLDFLLREVRQNTRPFGGVTIILGGDFRQVLPVIRHGNAGAVIDACMKRSNRWHLFNTVHLTENVRVKKQQGNPAYAEWLLRLGNGNVPVVEGTDDVIELPPKMCEPCDVDAAVDFAFPHLALHYHDASWIRDRAILAPHNATVQTLNDECLRRIPGEIVCLESANNAKFESEDDVLPPEFLSTLEAGNLPPHHLRVKNGAALILLRNINPAEGLCNGTRLILDETLPGNRVLRCRIASDDPKFNGKTVLIPRIKFVQKETDWGYAWVRRQFPVRLAYAITINKAQGQTLHRVAVWLEQPCFAHGQLYVASARCGDDKNVRFFVNPVLDDHPTSTYNVVYKEVLS